MAMSAFKSCVGPVLAVCTTLIASPPASAAAAPSAQAGPAPVHRFKLPASIQGHFDHFTVDSAGKRIFATAVEHQSIVVIDLGDGKVRAEIKGVTEPRAVLYRADIGRLFVSDGGGAVRVFDAKTYAPIKSLKIAVDADPIAYDVDTKRLFVVNGGEKAKHAYSDISVFDTDAVRQVGDIQIPGIEIEGMTIEKGGSRLFANNRDKNEIDILDRRSLQKVGVWPLVKIKRNTVSALDESANRLFVAGHEGELLVMDSRDGKELQVLPIGPGADDIDFDPTTHLIYVASGGGHGAVDVYEEIDPDTYKLRAHITTEPGAATARLVPNLNEYVVLAPPRQGVPAHVLVYDASKLH